MPKVNGTYLQTLQQEFTSLAEELIKMRSEVSTSGKQNLESCLQTHIKNFGDFRQVVLDNLSKWQSKSEGLSSLATRYLDTLEEYKMHFISMKQLLKEKD